MDIKSMASVGIDLDAGVNRLTARNIAEHTALGINLIKHKLTAERGYTTKTLEEAKIIVDMYGGQNFVSRLVAGEIVYYPLGELKLDATAKCGNSICNHGYLGAGFLSTTLGEGVYVCEDCNACELYDITASTIY